MNKKKAEIFETSDEDATWIFRNALVLLTVFNLINCYLEIVFQLISNPFQLWNLIKWNKQTVVNIFTLIRKVFNIDQ